MEHSIIMKKLFSVFFCILIISGFVGCNIHINKDGSRERNYQKDIYVIYYCHWDVTIAIEDTTAYKIDLQNSSFYEITSGAEYSKDQWGTALGDSDFVFVSVLQDGAVDDFFRQVARHGITNWERSYRDDTISGGSTWYIKILFFDGTTMESSGTNKYPDTWENVMQDFEDLTGREF